MWAGGGRGLRSICDEGKMCLAEVMCLNIGGGEGRDGDDTCGMCRCNCKY